jgi:hypothetical protein
LWGCFKSNSGSMIDIWNGSTYRKTGVLEKVFSVSKQRFLRYEYFTPSLFAQPSRPKRSLGSWVCITCPHKRVSARTDPWSLGQFVPCRIIRILIYLGDVGICQFANGMVYLLVSTFLGGGSSECSPDFTCCGR